MVVCAACGQENPEGFRFCGRCGAALEAAPAREERKVVTVLFADLVGFTSRAEQMDPEDVRALLAPYHGRLRAELERFGGTVEKFIGDAVMALFGAPVAHEDDPERAVRAALAIRDWVREEEQLQVRIAVNTGEALIALGARPEAGEGMASGDVVNTTARMQSAAPVNGVLVGETTYRATKHAIDYRKHASVEAKGKAEPIAVWEALDARSRFGVDVAQESRAPLIGRTTELDALRQALTRARNEPSVQLVTLVGVPGIGKSRLVYELMQSVAAELEFTTWRQGRSLPYGEGVSYWALGEMIKAQAGVLESDTSDNVLEKLQRSVRALIDEPDAAWIESHLGTLVGLSDDGGSASTPNTEEAFAAWRRYFEALAAERPLVLVFEDLHWADDGLLDFVDHLVDWASDVPLLVVGTARPELLERRSGWGGGKRNATTLSLAPLDDDDTARLIAALLDRPALAAETQTALLERAQGNPLFAEQFVRMLAERGVDAAVPENVHGIIAARLDGLANDEKELLQDAAVLGKVFWSGALAQVAERDRRRVDELLHSLNRKEFVRRAHRSSLAGESEYAFRHILVRDVAYSQIPRAARLEKHLRVADWLESLGRLEDHAEMLAHHFAAAVELAHAANASTDDFAQRAHRAFAAAGDRAMRLNALSAAIRFYRNALAFAGLPDTEEARIKAQLGGALVLKGDDDAFAVLEDARDRLLACGEPAAAGQMEALLGEAWWWRGDDAEVRRHFDAAQKLVGDAPASREKGWVLARASRQRALAGENDLAVELAKEAVALADELNLPDVKSYALHYGGLARMHAGDAAGESDVHESLAIAREIGSLELVARCYANLAALTYDEGDLTRSDEFANQGFELTRQLGLGSRLLHGRAQLVWFRYDFGEWDRALDEIRDLLDAAGTMGVRIEPLWFRALIRVARGEDDAGERDLREAVDAARAVADAQAIIPTLCVAMRTFDDLGRVDDARAAADEMLTHPLVLDAPTYGLYQAAYAAGRLGHAETMRTVLDRHPHHTPWLDVARAIVDEEYERAAEIFATMGALPQEADMHRFAAERLVRANRRAEADHHLQKALAFYRSVGATRYVREAEALLAAAS